MQPPIMTTFDVKNPDHLCKAIAAIKANPSAVDGMMGRFPFRKLFDVPPLDVEIISGLCDLTELFVKYALVSEVLPTLLTFYHQHIRFYIESDECDFELVEKILKIFMNALIREAELELNYLNEALIQTMHKVVHLKGSTPVMLRCAILIFACYIDRRFVKDAEFGTQCADMWKVTTSLELDGTLKLANSLIRNTQPENFPKIDDVYMYLLDTVPLLPQSHETLINEILLCVIEAYNKCKSKETLMTLSVALARVDFPRSIAHYFRVAETNSARNLLQMHEILFNELSTIFEKTPWNSAQEDLREAIKRPDNPFLAPLDQRDPAQPRTDEFEFLVYYLELVYMEHYERTLVPDMVGMFGKKLPTNPAVLKAVYFLFAAYADDQPCIGSRALQNELLMSLQLCDDLENILTYHIAQLLWVLQYGSRILRRRVVSMWIKTNNESILTTMFSCLKHADQQKLLLDVICYADEARIKNDALDLFLMCVPKPRYQLTLALLRPDLTMDTLDCIMKGNPQVLELSNTSDATDEFKEGLSMLRALLQRLIMIVTDKNIVLLDSTKNRLLIHLYNTCLQLSKTESAANFVLGKLVKVLVDATTCKCPADACNAFQFLMLIATTQTRLRMSIYDNIEMEPPTLHGDPRLIVCAVRFYLYVLNHSCGDYKMISMVDNNKPLMLYHQMMEILTCSVGHVVYELVVMLMDRFEECVRSVINISTIRLHCRNVNTDVNFVKYLTYWCQLAPKYDPYIQIPVRIIAPYVRHLDAIKYQAADYAALRRLTVAFKPDM